MPAQATQNETEAELVNAYLQDEFLPKVQVVKRRIRDPEVRQMAIEKTVRHFYHWNEERKLHAARDAIDENQDPDKEQAHEDAEKTAWDEESATERQLAYLRDRGVLVPEGVTKGMASKLISERIEQRAVSLARDATP